MTSELGIGCMAKECTARGKIRIVRMVLNGDDDDVMKRFENKIRRICTRLGVSFFSRLERVSFVARMKCLYRSDDDS